MSLYQCTYSLGRGSSSGCGTTSRSAVWLPLQQALTPDDLELLFWLDLVRTDSRVKQTET